MSNKVGRKASRASKPGSATRIQLLLLLLPLTSDPNRSIYRLATAISPRSATASHGCCFDSSSIQASIKSQFTGGLQLSIGPQAYDAEQSSSTSSPSSPSPSSHARKMRHHRRLLAALARRPPAPAATERATTTRAGARAVLIQLQQHGQQRSPLMWSLRRPFQSSSSSSSSSSSQRRLFSSNSSAPVTALDDIIVTNACVKVRALRCAALVCVCRRSFKTL